MKSSSSSSGILQVRLLLIFVIISSSCTSSDGSPSGGSGSTIAGEQATTTAAPLMLALTPNLDLEVATCWAELPPPEESTTTTHASTETTPATVETTPETLGDPATTIPSPTIVAEVDCAGTNEGRVFATFCLQQNPATDDLARFLLIATECNETSSEDDSLDTDSPDSAALETPWPGDRDVRRAAARLCLLEFEEVFGEPYSESEWVAKEFVPTEGIWMYGRRNVVCWVDSVS